MSEQKKFYAFISYKREEKKEAKRLQHQLEYYRLPNQLRKDNPDLPEYVRPVFRDMTDLEVGELSTLIHEALEQSHYLIVVCSPRAAKSKWVNDEVEYFISLGKQDKIIPYIIEGVPHAEDPSEECYPPALLRLSKEKELLGANINEVGKEAAGIRVVAKMFGIRYDTLYQRYKREQRRKFAAIIFSIIAIFLFMLSFIGYALLKNNQLEEKNNKINTQKERLLSDSIIMAARMDSIIFQDSLISMQKQSIEEKNIDLSKVNVQLNVARDKAQDAAAVANKAKWNAMVNQGRAIAEKAKLLIEDGDSYLARMVIADALSPNRPYVPDLEEALRLAFLYNSAVLRTDAGNESALFSPDGKYIVSGDERGKIKIWDASNGCLLRNINAYDNKYSASLTIAFSPNGENFASTSESDSTIKIWDVNTGNLLHQLIGHSANIRSAVFNNIGNQIISTARDSTIKIWDVNTEKAELSFKDENANVMYAEFCPDGEKILEVAYDSLIRIRNSKTGLLIKVLQGHKMHIESAKYSPDGKKIISASYDNIKIWDAKTYVELKSFNSSYQISDAIYTPDGMHIVVYSHINDTIRMISPETGQVEKVFSKHNGWVNNVSISNDSKRLVSASDDQTIRVWDLFDCRGNMINPKGHFFNVLYSRDGERIIARTLGKAGSKIQLWNALDGTYKESLIDIQKCNGEMALSSDGKYLAISNQELETSLFWYDLEKREIAHSIKDTLGYVQSLSFSSDNKKLISITGCHNICIWDVASGKLLKTVDCSNIHSEGINDVCYGYNDRMIITSSIDSTIGLIDATTFKLVNRLVGHSGTVIQSVPSKKENILYTASSDNTIRIWDVINGTCIDTLHHSLCVNSISLSEDENWLVSGADDKYIRVWNTKTAELVCMLSRHNEPVSTVEFSPNGHQILSRSLLDNLVVLWDFPPLQELIDMTRERFKDTPLTPEERRKYYLE